MQMATAHPLHSMEILDNDGGLHIDRQALRDSLYHISAFPGVTELLNWDQFGDCGKTTSSILCLDAPVQCINGLESTIVYSWVHS